MNGKEKLQSILNGESKFYFRFKRIGLYENGRCIANFTDENSPGGGSTFRQGGIWGMYAKIDIDEDDTWSMIQQAGAFKNMYSAFDFLLDDNGWHINTDSPDQFSIIYPIMSGEIDSLTLIAEGNVIRLQVNAGSFILLLTDILNFN